MRKQAIEDIREQLLEKKQQLLQRLVRDHADFLENQKHEGGDSADEASEIIERELIYDLSLNEKKELQDINDVLQKIDEGVYGVCEICGIEIPIERLKIKPYAKTCVKCKEDSDRKNHNHFKAESYE